MSITAVGSGFVLVLVVVVHDGDVVEVGLVGGLVLVVVHDVVVWSNLLGVEGSSDPKSQKGQAFKDFGMMTYFRTSFSPVGRSGRLSRAASAGGFYSRTPSGCPSRSNQI